MTESHAEKTPGFFQAPSDGKPVFIQKIRVDGLFGYQSYTIPNDIEDPNDYSRLIILYGDNGSGKTTILRLLFCLLSSADGRGDKSYIARTPFRRYEVFFNDGTSVFAERSKDILTGSYTVGIIRPDGHTVRYPMNADSENSIRRSHTFPDGEPERDAIDELLDALATIGVVLHFLPDDRRIRTSSPSELDSLPSSRRQYASRFIEHRQGGTIVAIPDDPEVSHHLDIGPALEGVNRWFRSHAYVGSSTGDQNITSIYLSVVEQIAQLAIPTEREEQQTTKALIERIDRIGNRINGFTKFGLATPFPAKRIRSALTAAKATVRGTIETVLEPYIDGIEARLDALDDVRNVIATYIDTINLFLSGKSVEFSIHTGVKFRGFGGVELTPQNLSSGEKQLILLLSNTILAKESATIFLIDEPELSLNIKWQRNLVEALLRCSENSNIQYILASHSLELITQHNENAVRLLTQTDAGK